MLLQPIFRFIEFHCVLNESFIYYTLHVISEQIFIRLLWKFCLYFHRYYDIDHGSWVACRTSIVFAGQTITFGLTFLLLLSLAPFCSLHYFKFTLFINENTWIYSYVLSLHQKHRKFLSQQKWNIKTIHRFPSWFLTSWFYSVCSAEHIFNANYLQYIYMFMCPLEIQ